VTITFLPNPEASLTFHAITYRFHIIPPVFAASATKHVSAIISKMAKDNLDNSRAAASPGKVTDETSTLPAPGPRRSGRARKQTDLFGAQDVVKEATTAKTSPTQPAQTRRNPKRKAAPEVFDVPDDLLEASLGPWDENEKADWPSWTDVESDPVNSLFWVPNPLGSL